VIFWVLVLAPTQSVSASDQVRRFRVGGLFGAATASHEDLNESIDDVGALLSIIDCYVTDWSDDEVGGGRIVGVFAEYSISDRFSLGADFLRLSGRGGYGWYGCDPSGHSSDYIKADVDYEVTGNLFSGYGAYRLPLGDSRLSLRARAGVGYLPGAALEVSYQAREEPEHWRGSQVRRDGATVWQANLGASGSAVTYHGLVGAEYDLTDRLVLKVSVAYRLARVGELEVKHASASGAPDGAWPGIEKGEILRWYNEEYNAHFSTSVGDRVGLDFGGVQLIGGLAYTF
jgi:opacity protein-like surface antigen